MVGIEYTMEDYERWRRYGLANKAMERILIMYHELAEVKGGAQKGKLRAGPVAMPEDFVLIDCSARRATASISCSSLPFRNTSVPRRLDWP